MYRILYVDDESDLLGIGKLFLEESGDFTVTTALSAPEGIHLLEQEKFDVIVSDYQMPDMDGIQFLVEVRTRFGPIPFILFTGRGREEVVIQAINSGADFYLQKGGDPDAQFAELSHKIKSAALRNRAEDSLRNSEERFRLLVQNSNDIIQIMDQNGVPFYISDQLLRILGYHPEERIGRSSLSDIHPDDFPAVRDVLSNLIENPGTTRKIEYRYRHKNGNWVDLEAIGCNMLDDPSIHGIFLNIRDIIDKKRAEKDKAFQNILLSTQQETSIDAILVVDENGKILNYNQKFIEIWRIPGELIAAMVDEPVLQFVVGQQADPEAFISRVRYLYANKVEKSFEEILLKDGRILERFSAPMLGETGTYYGRVWYFRDITKRKRMEEALDEREKKFRGLFENAIVGIYQTALDGTLLIVNNAFARIFGYNDADEILAAHLNVGKDCYADPQDRRRVMASILEKGTVYLPELAVLKRDNSRVWVSMAARVIRSDDGTVLYFEGTLIDITDFKRTEDHLRSREEQLRRAEEVGRSGSWEIRLDDKTVVASEGARRIYDLKERYLTLEHIQNVPLPEYRPVLDAALKDLIAGKSAYNIEFRIQRKSDGLVRDIHSLAEYDPTKKTVLGVIHDVTERKQAEEALRLSEEKYRTYVDSSPEGIFIVDSEGNYLDVNPSACSMTGYTREEFLSLTIRDLVPPDYRTSSVSRFSKLLETGLLMSDSVLIKKNGDLLPVILNATRLPNGNYLGICIDITKRRLAEEALKENDAFLRQVINGAHEGIIVYNKELRITLWNPFMEEMTGLKAEYVQGKLAVDIFPFIREKGIETLLKQALSGVISESTDFEYIIRSTGKKGWVKGIYAPHYDSHNTIVGVIGIVRDISKRKQAEREMFESEERYSSLFSNNYSVSLLIDPNTGRIVDANAAAYEYYGYSHEQLVGMGIYEINRQDKEKVIRNLSRAKKERHFFSTHFLADGKQRNVEIYSGPIPVKGEILFYSIIHDVTDKVKYEKALQEANKKLNLLSSITRHDINNQLSVLQGYIRILEKKQPDLTLIEYFQKAAFSAQRISSIIQFTKEYEKIGVNAPVWQNCRSLVNTAAKDFPLGQVVLKNDLPAGAEVFGDPLIVKVLYNLMDNAVQYGGKITTIRFSVDKCDGEHIMVCEDDGDGVVAGEKEKIFDRGFGKNTGLGLALAREILGITSITIRETGEPGKGARFEMTVPKGAWRTAKDA